MILGTINPKENFQKRISIIFLGDLKKPFQNIHFQLPSFNFATNINIYDKNQNLLWVHNKIKKTFYLFGCFN